MKTITFTVEMTTKINDDVNPEDVAFNIDTVRVLPFNMKNGETIGMVTGYLTIGNQGEEG